MLALAREIRKPRAYVGYSAFVLMGLATKCQPCVWEGSNFINLLDTHAPWALEHCNQEALLAAVSCFLVPRDSRLAECVPVSEKHDIKEGKTMHFVGGATMPVCAAALLENNPTFEVFDSAIGVAIIPTVADGDCGPDTMTKMLGRPQTFESRKKLRLEIADYLLERVREPWMHDLMACLQEVEWEDVRAYR